MTTEVISLGECWHNRPLVFLVMPHCHGLCRSANQPGCPSVRSVPDGGSFLSPVIGHGEPVLRVDPGKRWRSLSRRPRSLFRSSWPGSRRGYCAPPGCRGGTVVLALVCRLPSGQGQGVARSRRGGDVDSVCVGVSPLRSSPRVRGRRLPRPKRSRAIASARNSPRGMA